MRTLNVVFLVLLGAALAVFCVQNLSAVQVNYLAWNANIPIALLIFVVYLIGMVSGWGVFSLVRRTLNDAAKSKPAKKNP